MAIVRECMSMLPCDYFQPISSKMTNTKIVARRRVFYYLFAFIIQFSRFLGLYIESRSYLIDVSPVLHHPTRGMVQKPHCLNGESSSNVFIHREKRRFLSANCIPVNNNEYITFFSKEKRGGRGVSTYQKEIWSSDAWVCYSFSLFQLQQG